MLEHSINREPPTGLLPYEAERAGDMSVFDRENIGGEPRGHTDGIDTGIHRLDLFACNETGEGFRGTIAGLLGIRCDAGERR